MQAERKHAVVWLGALMLIGSAALQLVFPRAMGPLPPGLKTPVLALEIARSSAELEAMFGPAGSSERAEWTAAVDRGNVLDFGFIVLYGAFLIACVRLFEAARPSRARLAVALALLACIADAAENGFLFRITAHLGGDYAGAITGLMIATWLKWLALGGVLAVLSPAVRARGGWGKAAGWIAAAPLPLALGACALRGVLAESMLAVIAVAFIALWIAALRRPRSAGTAV